MKAIVFKGLNCWFNNDSTVFFIFSSNTRITVSPSVKLSTDVGLEPTICVNSTKNLCSHYQKFGPIFDLMRWGDWAIFRVLHRWVSEKWIGISSLGGTTNFPAGSWIKLLDPAN